MMTLRSIPVKLTANLPKDMIRNGLQDRPLLAVRIHARLVSPLEPFLVPRITVSFSHTAISLYICRKKHDNGYLIEKSVCAQAGAGDYSYLGVVVVVL